VSQIAKGANISESLLRRIIANLEKADILSTIK
jgi:DNA-binding IscR family transcriptional regulator